MRRKDLEKLPFVSIKGKVYVELDAVVEALEAEAEAQTEPARALPRKVETAKKDEA